MTMPSMCKKVVVFDLDDTLYKEIDYLKSGYRKVAELVEKRFHYDAREVYERLYDCYVKGENSFFCLNETYGLDNPISDYLNVYRLHQPSITLSDGVEDTLNELKRRGVKLGLITDGRTISQKNKINALGLNRWFDEQNIIISEEFGSEKTDERNFRYFLDLYPGCKYCYVGDNPKKDFVVPNLLHWETIMLKDNGRNIHKQEPVAEGYLPQHTITEIEELLDFIR